MVEKIIMEEIQNHRHISQRQAEWYVNLLHKLSLEHRCIEDLFTPFKLLANYIHHKRSSCKTCYETFSKEYYKK